MKLKAAVVADSKSLHWVNLKSVLGVDISVEEAAELANMERQRTEVHENLAQNNLTDDFLAGISMGSELDPGRHEGARRNALWKQYRAQWLSANVVDQRQWENYALPVKVQDEIEARVNVEMTAGSTRKRTSRFADPGTGR